MAVYPLRGLMGNNKILTFLVTGDIDKISGDYISSKASTDFNETAQIFDEELSKYGFLFPWESVVFPANDYIINGEIKKQFPGLFLSDIETGTQCSLFDTPITSVTNTTSSGGSGVNAYNKTVLTPDDDSIIYSDIFNLENTLWTSTLKIEYSFYCIFADENCVENGKFNLSGHYIQTRRFLVVYLPQTKQWNITGLPASNSLVNYSPIDGLPANKYSDDPFNPGGETNPGGGEGNFDNNGDEIATPEIPTISAVDSGFIKLYSPTPTQLKELADYMWSDLFDIDTLKKLFADPMEVILGLSILPIVVPTSGIANVKVGNIDTGISLNVASSQYITVECGTLNINEYWGAYLDYEPYTRCELYLPFIGVRAISTDDIMGKAVSIKYIIDILSGSCCAFVSVNNTVIYQFVGQCSCSVPVTGNDWTNVINGALSVAAAIGVTVASGGTGAPAVAAVASSAANAAVNNVKPNISKSGSMGGMGGILGVRKPYLIVTRPRQALPAGQNTYMGYPSFITSILGELTGYTVVAEIHLQDVPATDNELTEIENLLKMGVYI